MPPSLSELTPMIFNTELTHLGSEASIYLIQSTRNPLDRQKRAHVKKGHIIRFISQVTMGLQYN